MQPVCAFVKSDSILNVAQCKKLETYYDPTAAPQQWVRCYSTKNDGLSPSTFHSHCDQFYETMTIIKDGSYIWGGFASTSWNKGCGDQRGDSSWLFTLKPQMYKSAFFYEESYGIGSLARRTSSYSQCRRGSQYGPQFGYNDAGADMYPTSPSDMRNYQCSPNHNFRFPDHNTIKMCQSQRASYTGSNGGSHRTDVVEVWGKDINDINIGSPQMCRSISSFIDGKIKFKGLHDGQGPNKGWTMVCFFSPGASSYIWNQGSTSSPFGTNPYQVAHNLGLTITGCGVSWCNTIAGDYTSKSGGINNALNNQHHKPVCHIICTAVPAEELCAAKFWVM
eukprot:COSAG01_NODE_9192_length_2525_cov_9.446826_2_plen_335_part_00